MEQYAEMMAQAIILTSLTLLVGIVCGMLGFLGLESLGWLAGQGWTH